MHSAIYRVFVVGVVALGVGSFAGSDARASEAEWEDIFNGKDLTGWETWLRAPEDQGGQKGTPIGLNEDPVGVFTIEDGVLRISGEIFGCISSLEPYEDYHIRFDFRWGEKKWPPRVNALRDSGFLYHCYGRHGAFWKAWKACVEYQVQEGDVGDLIFLAGPWGKTLLAEGKDGKRPHIYNPLGDMVKAPRTRHSGKYEYANGEWNTCQVIARGADVVHIVNGFVINRVFDLQAKQDGEVKPLTSGHLQFQSEAAEVFYRRIQKRDISDSSNVASQALRPNQTELEVGPEAIELSYVNTGNVPMHIPAVELLGDAASDFRIELPEMPAVVGTSETFSISVRRRAKAKPDSQVTFRLEGLDGPLRDSEVQLRGSSTER